MVYKDLTDLELVTVTNDFTESWITGLTDTEIQESSAADIKEWMIMQAADSDAEWADMIDNMTSDELDELSASIARRSKTWLDN